MTEKMHLEHDDYITEKSPSGIKTEYEIIELDRDNNVAKGRDTHGRVSAWELDSLEELLLGDRRGDNGYKYNFSNP